MNFLLKYKASLKLILIKRQLDLYMFTLIDVVIFTMQKHAETYIVFIWYAERWFPLCKS